MAARDSCTEAERRLAFVVDGWGAEMVQLRAVVDRAAELMPRLGMTPAERVHVPAVYTATDHIRFFGDLTGQLAVVRELMDGRLTQEGVAASKETANFVMSHLRHASPDISFDSLFQHFPTPESEDEARAAVFGDVDRVLEEMEHEV